MCTVETGTTTVSTSSNETTKYSCQDNAERGWIISCVYRCVCMYVCVSEETRVTRETGFKNRVYRKYDSLLVFPPDRGNTRIFKESIRGRRDERRMRQGGMMNRDNVGGFRRWIRVFGLSPSISSFGNHLEGFQGRIVNYFDETSFSFFLSEKFYIASRLQILVGISEKLDERA